MSKWLSFVRQRERGAGLWIAGSGWVLAAICLFGAVNGLQGAIAQAGSSAAQNGILPSLALQLEGIKYQVWIVLALTVRWLGLFAFQSSAPSTKREWISNIVAETGLLLAAATLAWYGWVSHRAFVSQSSNLCKECLPPSDMLLGTNQLWGSVLVLVVLVQVVYGIVRSGVPLIDVTRKKNEST